MEKEGSSQKSIESVLTEELKAASIEVAKVQGEIKKDEGLSKQDFTVFEAPKPPKQTEQPVAKTEEPMLKIESEIISLEQKSTQTDENISKEELSIDDLHNDLESKLKEQGFIFDRKKFIFSDKNLTFGEKLADKVASFGGSWRFIIVFGCFIGIWILLNILLFSTQESFDPFPFILLNLILSCLASLQAPIIMMSQNRHAMREKKQEEINIEKEILDFKQDRLDLILDQKQWDLLRGMDDRLKNIEQKLEENKKEAEAAALKTVKKKPITMKNPVVKAVLKKTVKKISGKKTLKKRK